MAVRSGKLTADPRAGIGTALAIGLPLSLLLWCAGVGLTLAV